MRLWFSALNRFYVKLFHHPVKCIAATTDEQAPESTEAPIFISVSEYIFRNDV